MKSTKQVVQEAVEQTTGPFTSADIAKVTRMTRSNVSRRLYELAQKGMVTKVATEADGTNVYQRFIVAVDLPPAPVAVPAPTPAPKPELTPEQKLEDLARQIRAVMGELRLTVVHVDQQGILRYTRLREESFTINL